MSGFFYGMRFEAPEKEVWKQTVGRREYAGAKQPLSFDEVNPLVSTK